MTTFVVLYRGHTVSSAKMVGVSTEQELVKYAATIMLADKQAESDYDAVLRAIADGHCQGLRLITRILGNESK